MPVDDIEDETMETADVANQEASPVCCMLRAQQHAVSMHRRSNLEASGAAWDRLPFDLMDSLSNLMVFEGGVPSTIGRGWIYHTTEDGQTYACNTLSGHTTWQPAQCSDQHEI
eukprot:CAMPEP_0183350948 /NCGR_PEP_ID=MMETSP0164_2-20130417/22335_1 /TAXON_ID=221442 /ORGANISM="Coccolithus pelagicus ssp braarudi, Strain PLY182g" /LENGTH=112 /DNA_ID=CAMNT_0025523003 /DNA_START=90 /DNA_END=428 /DNA_ORIENTATION=-